MHVANHKVREMVAVTLTKPKSADRTVAVWRWRPGLGLVAMIAAAVLTMAHPVLACEAPPPAVRDIALPRFYADQAGAVIDPQQKAAHAQAVAPLKDFVGEVTSFADKSWKRSKPSAQAEVGVCAAAWIAAWAKDGALLGRMETKQAEYERKWDHGALALAYLKVRRFASPEQRALIEPWLIKLADAGRAFFDDPQRKRNNHWYWLGLGVGATALATGSKPHWQLAKSIFDDAMRDIGPDGAIAHEMAREMRALHYHDFAVMPLVVLAELAAARGEDWYQGQGAALHRLVGLTLAGHADPGVFDRLAGLPQERPVRVPAGWVDLYRARFPERAGAGVVQSKPGHRWLGGDTGVLAAVLRER